MHAKHSEMKEEMTKQTLLRVCAAFEIATGVASIANPDFVVREIFGGGSSGDFAITRAVGVGPLVLGLVCWPSGDDIAARIIWAQLAYNLFTAIYLGFLRLAGGFASTLLWPLCALHAVIALMLAGLVYEKHFNNKDTSRKPAVARNLKRRAPNLMGLRIWKELT